MNFDDPNEGLSDLYFIDPRWLCALMAGVITIRGSADLVKDGILEIQKTRTLFKSGELPWDFYEQYVRLLVRFQIVYLLDSSRILVPSKLPEKEPEAVTTLQLSYAPVRRLYRIDYQRIHGFWPRFMSRFFFYVKEMIAVDATRYHKAEEGEHRFFGHFCRSCLRVDDSSTRKFSCFMDSSQWEPSKTHKPSRGSTSPSSATASGTSPTERTNGPARNGPSGKGASGRSSTRKDPSKKESMKKTSSKKEHSKKKSSKRESTRTDSSAKGPSKEEHLIPRHEPKGNDFSTNASASGTAVYSGGLGGTDDFQALLMDPSVKIFSDDELQDETDGERIIINQVDTAMDYSQR